jgi:hypothetical protein
MLPLWPMLSQLPHKGAKVALLVVMTAARKALDEALACERDAALTWEEKINAWLLEQQPIVAQEIEIPTRRMRSLRRR